MNGGRWVMELRCLDLDKNFWTTAKETAGGTTAKKNQSQNGESGV